MPCPMILLFVVLLCSDVRAEKTNGRFKRSSGSPGTVYTRWGRKGCPTNNDCVYTGVVGGAHYQHQGSGANYLCLPKIPEWSTIRSGIQSCGTYIYGAEYEMCANGNVYSWANSFGRSLHNQNVPCAVCLAGGKQSHVMIPAKTSCPWGWVKEYQGFLVSAYWKHHRSEWVCMDGAPETLPGGHTDQNGALFYVTEASCGSLPCPPYHDGHELACVVCTK